MIVTLDYETYYSREYSLSRMTTEAYIFDPRFQIICCSVKEGDAPTECHVGHNAVKKRLAQIDWSRCSMLAHNTVFDGSILYWLFGHMPALFLDTLSMARALTHALKGKSSLKAVAEYLGLPPKGTAVVDALGKRLENFTPAELQNYIDYCMHDTDLSYMIFKIFMRVFPKRELSVIDQTLRMFIEPAAVLDMHKLHAHLGEQVAIKDALLANVNMIDKSVFSSNAKFAALLESKGVDVPMKMSATTGDLIPAIAKNDRAFKELCDDTTQPPEIQALLAARVGVKSTIEVTRTQRLIGICHQPWPAHLGQHWLPVPIAYHAAHTSRFGGWGGINLQNLQRMSKLRDAIEAPPGYRIVHRDSSQIEARLVSWCARALRLLRAFRNGIDVYSEFATGFYKRPITKADKGERFVGKTSVLGLGYGCGALKFRHMLFIGNGGISVKASEEEAKTLVNFYRYDYAREVPALWKFFDNMLEQMALHNEPAGMGHQVVKRSYMVGNDPNTGAHPIFNVLRFTPNAIFFPDGLAIQYPKLRQHRAISLATQRTQTQIVWNDPYGIPRPIWGGTVTENVCQKLARIVITDVMCRVKHETGYHPFMTTHDSLDYMVPEQDAPWWDDYLGKQFDQPPAWGLDLPLASEGGWGTSLAKAERAENR